MNRSNAWAWSLMLIATLFFGVGLGLSLGHAIWAPQTARVADAPPNDSSASPRRPSADPSTEPGRSAATAGTPRIKSARANAATPGEYWAARHLFVTVNGQWLADAAQAMLKDLRPGGVLLTENNLGSRAQTFALVREIKTAAGFGDGLGDLPLIAAQQEGGPYNQLAVENAPSAQAVAQTGDPELARKLGREYAEACVGRGIAIAFAPVLDVFEVGAINPGFAARSFGTDQSVVTTFGLAMADGLRQGGVLPVVKHFPGFGAATYGADGLLVVLNKDYGGLARVMYPFREAIRYGVPGVLVAHVAVPALDVDEPRRSAALSPAIVNDLMRERWGFEGVIVADDVAMNSMTREIGAEAAAVQALAAGCDAVLFLDPDPGRIRAVAAAIATAVENGQLSRERLEQSVRRLERWQDAIGNLNPIETAAPDPGDAPTQISESPPPARTEDTESLPTTPQQLAAASPQLDGQAPSTRPTTVEPEPQLSTQEEPSPAPAPATALSQSPPRAPDSPVESRAESKSTQPQELPTNTPPTEAAATVVASAPPRTEPAKPAPDADSPKVGATSEPPAPDPEPSEEQATVNVEETKPRTSGEPEVPQPEVKPLETDVAKLDSPPPAAAAPSSSPKSDSAPPTEEPKIGSTVTAEEVERSSVVHTVKEGELLSAVAQLYAVAVTDLVRWNKLDSAQVTPGTDLTIYLPETEAAPATNKKAPATLPPEEPNEPQPEVVVPAGKLVHTVIDGDSLSSVAEKYGVSMTDLALWNGLQEAALKPGQLLTVFLDAESAASAGASGPAPVPAPDDASTVEAVPNDETAVARGGPVHYSPETRTIDYEIKPGDTLRKIAREHETTLETLLSLNNLKDANHIMVGSKLKVPAP